MNDLANRLHRAQRAMADAGLAALLLTTEAEIRYFTGFLTRFWESPTRPWFLIVPASGDVIAVIPAIGAPLMARAGVADIRTWPSPRPDDDGTTLLADTLLEVAGDGAIGLPMGPESHLRMPLDAYHRLGGLLAAGQLRDDAGIARRLRMVKSDHEIALIRTACSIANRAFARVPQIARKGVPLAQVFRDFQRLCLEEGADAVPYLAGAAGHGGYDDVISPATDAPLQAGDVLMLDTGLTHRGYFCDFDRNFAVGAPSPATQSAHAQLIDATAAGVDAARPGATAADVWRAMAKVCDMGSEDGRLGHGIGMQLTEGLSLMAADHTELLAGMTLTLEPMVRTSAGGILVHEENILIRAEGPEWLSDPAPAAIRVI